MLCFAKTCFQKRFTLTTTVRQQYTLRPKEGGRLSHLELQSHTIDADLQLFLLKGNQHNNNNNTRRVKKKRKKNPLLELFPPVVSVQAATDCETVSTSQMSLCAVLSTAGGAAYRVFNWRWTVQELSGKFKQNAIYLILCFI